MTGAIALYSIYLAFNANTLSKTALNLSKSDTSQQAQINKLNDIAVKLITQNELAAAQIEQLVKITREANNINLATNQLLTALKVQRGLISDQLTLSQKRELNNLINDSLAKQSDYSSLSKTFESFYNLKTLVQIMKMAQDSNMNSEAIVLHDIQISMLPGFDNKILQSDTALKNNWTASYQLVKVASFIAAAYDQNKRDIRFKDVKEAQIRLQDKFSDYCYKIQKRLHTLGKTLNLR